METPHLEDKAERYFSSLSPMARRVMVDTAAIKAEHSGEWAGLSYEQQCDALMKQFASPLMLDKYAYYPEFSNNVQSFPKLMVCTGEKFVVYEEQGKGSASSWRDEHSAPFLWETKSQLNLSYADETVEKPHLDAAKRRGSPQTVAKATTVAKAETDVRFKETVEDDQSNKTGRTKPEKPSAVKRPVTKPPAPPNNGSAIASKLSSVAASKRQDERQALPIPKMALVKKAEGKSRTTDNVHTQCDEEEPKEDTALLSNKADKKMVVEKSEVKYSMADCAVTDSSDCDYIPKTGFDFLDNW